MCMSMWNRPETLKMKTLESTRQVNLKRRINYLAGLIEQNKVTIIYYKKSNDFHGKSNRSDKKTKKISQTWG